MKPIHPRFSSRLVLALAASLLVGLGSASAQLVESFQFNDTAGTGLTGVANSVSGGATFASSITGVTTNGTGSLIIASNSTGASARSFADIANISTGIYQFDVNVAGWNFTGSPAAGPLLEIGLSAATTNANSVRIAHIFLEANNTGTVLAGVAAGTDALSTARADDQVFGLVQATPVTFRLTVDFGTFDYAISHSANGFITAATGTIADPVARPAAFIQLRAFDNFAIGGTGFLAIDSITLTAIPEPSAFPALAGIAVLGFVATRRRRR